MSNSYLTSYSALFLSTTILSSAAFADSHEVTLESLQKMQEALQQQQLELQKQQLQLDEQRRELQAQRQQLQKLVSDANKQKQIPQQATNVPARTSSQVVASSSSQAAPERVGQSPERESETPDLTVISDVGGVLTPKGTFVLEPAFEISQSADGRFFFQGIQIVDSFLIGLIEVSDVSRQVLTGSLGVRYGMTERLEADARVSYQYREDKLNATPLTNTGMTRLSDLDSAGLGDVEFGLHYQINRKRGNWPYAVANLRVKSDTGKGPFEVDRDSEGIETELATGSGFWSVEPSITFIYPTDPAVLFANVGYLYNHAESINKMIGPRAFIHDVDPGDAVKFSVGMGLGLNERLSTSFGYSHSYLFPTETDLTRIELDGMGMEVDRFRLKEETRATHIGTFHWGLSYSVNERVNVNMNLGIGVTEDAPDLSFMIRVPVKLSGN